MSEPIKAGDLMIVVRENPCACGQARKALGEIFRVREVRMSHGLRCAGCRKHAPREEIVATSGEMNGKSAMVFELWRLKRIPPLGELGDVKQDEEITA